MSAETIFIADYFLFGLITAIVVAACVPLIDQHYLQFLEQDPALSFITPEETVSDFLLIIICIPIALAAIILQFLIPSSDKKFSDFNIKVKLIRSFFFVLGLIMSILTAVASTSVMKSTVGRPRPIAFYSCNYFGYKDAVQSGNFTTYYQLTTFNKVGHVSHCYEADMAEDMWSSFPSGHASFSFCTMVYAYFLITMTLSMTKGVYYGWKNLIAFSPIIVCTWIAMTRLTNLRHHVDDVLAGAMIGTVCAYFSWTTTLNILNVQLPKLFEKNQEDYNADAMSLQSLRV